MRFYITLVELVNPVAQIHRGREGIPVARINLITRNLLSHEPVIRLVGIERLDDIITVTPCLGSGVVGVVAIGIGVAHQIQPSLRLMLTVARTGQQTINHFPVGIRR